MSKKIIYGDTVGTPMPRSDWAEQNERSAAYIKNKPTEDIKKNTEARHTHENGEILDMITEDMLDGKGLTDEQAADLAANTEARHTHDNQELLDNITEDMLQSIGTDKPVVIKTGIRYAGAISSNVCTVFETKMDRLAITALLDASAKNTIPEYVFIFTSGAGGFPTTFSMPRDIKWANDDIPEIKVDCKYIIRIFDNVASYTEVTI